MKLSNKTVVITGASSGIGKAFALKCAKDGATVVLAARSIDKLNEVAREIEQLGGIAITVQTDVTKPEEVRNLFLKATENNRVLDVVFDNAGLGYIGKIWELTTDQITSMISVNTLGMIFVAKYSAEVFQRQKYGHLVLTSSLAGLISLPEWSVYVSSKWAITGFAESIRYELAPYNVKVTSLHPGMVNTEFFAKEKANQDILQLDKNALSPEDVANEVYDSLFTNKKKIIIPTLSKSLAFLQKYLPNLKDTLLNNLAGNIEYNKEDKEDEPSFSYIQEVK